MKYHILMQGLDEIQQGRLRQALGLLLDKLMESPVTYEYQQLHLLLNSPASWARVGLGGGGGLFGFTLIHYHP